jgi:hypothetical protein
VASTTIHALLAAAPRFVRRQAKTVRQLPRALLHSQRVGFVFGCQRSGTKMVMRILDEAPDTRIFHENHAIAFLEGGSGGVISGVWRAAGGRLVVELPQLGSVR